MKVKNVRRVELLSTAELAKGFTTNSETKRKFLEKYEDLRLKFVHFQEQTTPAPVSVPNVRGRVLEKVNSLFLIFYFLVFIGNE